MAKAAVFLPGSIPEETVWEQLKRYPNIEPVFVEQVSNNTVETYARQLQAEECDLFIARGWQAQILERTTNIPVVSLRITAQELAELVRQIQKDFRKRDMRAALVGFANMYCDTSSFEELFGIRFQKYFLDSLSELDETMQKIREDGMEVLIGGRHSCEAAEKLGIPAYFASGGTEGLAETLNMAQVICELIDTKRHDMAEMNAMIQYNFNGILQIGRDGVVINANRVMQGILERDRSEIIGKEIGTLIREIGMDVLRDTLEKGERVFSRMVFIDRISYAVNISPVEIGGKVTGAFLTFQEGRRIRQLDRELIREQLSRGYYASQEFGHYTWESPQMKELVSLAKSVASADVPVMITGEEGLEQRILAECMHNASMVRENGFVAAECSAYDPDTLDSLLFGDEENRKESSLTELANEGTLYLAHAEKLSAESQYKLVELLHGRVSAGRSGFNPSVKIRLITSVSTDLREAVESGDFRSDLYYDLSVVRLDIPPLRRRREDISFYIRYYMEIFQKQYDRYIRLTAGALKILQEYDWPGNLSQMANVSQKIVLLCGKRDADEHFVQDMIRMSDPVRTNPAEGADMRQKILHLLEVCHGNREKVARELGISKTTLWRYMKKLEIEE